MTSIAALITTEAERLTIERALAAVAPVRVCDRAASLRALVAAGGVRIVVSELRDSAGVSMVPLLEDIAGRGSAPAIMVWVQLDRHSAPDVFALARTGTPAHLVLRGVDDLTGMARAILAGRDELRAALPILERIAPLVPRSLGTFMVLCAVRGSPWLELTRVSALLGVGRRTIEMRLTRAGFPPAFRVIGWCTVLRAAWRLDVLGQRPKQVAASLGFATRAALANVLSRYGQISATELRDNGGFAAMRERFVEYLEWWRTHHGGK